MMHDTSHDMTGKTTEFAVFSGNVEWLAMAAWVVANAVAGVALVWVAVNEPAWLLIT